MTDIQGLPQASAGPSDTSDFLRLFSVHQKEIYHFIGSFLRNPAAIDEVLQETSIVMWKKFGEFQPNTNFVSWAFSIARLEVLRYVRNSKGVEIPFSDELVDLLTDDRCRQFDYLDRRRAALSQCLQKLSARDRSLIEDCYRSGLLIRQVAERINRPANAVYQSLSRIRRWLHECINRTLAVQED